MQYSPEAPPEENVSAVATSSSSTTPGTDSQCALPQCRVCSSVGRAKADPPCRENLLSRGQAGRTVERWSLPDLSELSSAGWLARLHAKRTRSCALCRSWRAAMSQLLRIHRDHSKSRAPRQAMLLLRRLAGEVAVGNARTLLRVVAQLEDSEEPADVDAMHIPDLSGWLSQDLRQVGSLHQVSQYASKHAET